MEVHFTDFYLRRDISESMRFVSTSSAIAILTTRLPPCWVIVRFFFNSSELLGAIHWLGMAQRGFSSFTSTVLSRLSERYQRLWRIIKKVY